MNFLISLNDVKSKVVALVGRNGAGKSYALNRYLNDNPNDTLYVSEEGIAKVINQRNKVTLNMDEKKYIYTDELSRGKDTESEAYEISDNAMHVSRYCKEIKDSLEKIVNKSQGQRKLENMMNIFLSYNLNDIKMILFDEPENFLDEEFLKKIARLIGLLNECKYSVMIATHSSRLLSILEMNIGDIIFCNHRKLINFQKGTVKKYFIDIAKEIEQLRRNNRLNEDASIKYKLNIHEKEVVFNNYIDSNLCSTDFYSSLFYRKILIVEGISDREAVKTINEKLDDAMFVYATNGKAWIPFCSKLFQTLGKEVIVLIDSDNESNSHAKALTLLLNQMENIKLIEHNPDLESEYGIDLEKIATDLGMSSNIRNRDRGWVKQIAAYYYFNVQGNWNLLDVKINEKQNNMYEFS